MNPYPSCLSTKLPLYSIDTNLMHQQQTAFENTVGKGEIAPSEQFLLFPQCFLLNQITIPICQYFRHYNFICC